jgi:hypothetical protein
MIWPPLRAGDVAAIVLLAAIIGVVLLVFIGFPSVPRLRDHWGFGLDWECSSPGQGEPVCVKKPPARQGNSN